MGPRGTVETFVACGRVPGNAGVFAIGPKELATFEERLSHDGWRVGVHSRVVQRHKTLLRLEIEVEPGVRIMTSFDFTSNESGVAVYAGMGIRHDAVSGLYDEFLGLGGRSWTFAFSPADLLHKQGLRAAPYTRWLIASAPSVAAVADVLRADVARYGMPQAQPLLTPAGVTDRIASEGQRRDHAQHGILAVCHAVTGLWPATLAILEQYADEARHEPPAVAAQSWAFVQAFTEHFGLDTALLPFDIPGH